MIIEKKPTIVENHHNKLIFFQSARQAFGFVLNNLASLGDIELLLPDYIGYSSREGSGIYDPVSACGINCIFYHLDKQLQIDQRDLQKKLNTDTQKIVLLVHYFGIPDSGYEVVADMCKAQNVIIIEDAAHALYSDYVDHICGYRGDYILFSIHKMLPFRDGGMLKCNTNVPDFHTESSLQQTDVFEYDLWKIAQKRKENARIWNELLLDSKMYPHLMAPIYSYRPDATYQSFPIFVKNGQRDKLYFELNKLGYGAVSLYHQLINPLMSKEHDDALWVSEHILNLPVHQDVTGKEIKKMYKSICAIIEED